MSQSSKAVDHRALCFAVVEKAMAWHQSAPENARVASIELNAAVIKLKAFEKDDAVVQKISPTEQIRSGVWQHYRTLEKYLVSGVGRHTETDEELVSYVPLYVHPNGGLPLQFRPVSMWLARVCYEKVEYPRFMYLGDRLDPKPKPKPKAEISDGGCLAEGLSGEDGNG